MDWTKCIEVTPGVRGGKPCLVGARITPMDILEYLAGGAYAAVRERRYASGGTRRTAREIPTRREPESAARQYPGALLV
ncbi:MAG: DUF433 domain-containing protein [Steroidobacteraceae bacterium]